jgi:hypothetical protein
MARLWIAGAIFNRAGREVYFEWNVTQVQADGMENLLIYTTEE